VAITGSVVVVFCVETVACVLADAEPTSAMVLPTVPTAFTRVTAVLSAAFPVVVEPVPVVSPDPTAVPLDELVAAELESVLTVVPLTMVIDPLPLNVA